MRIQTGVVTVLVIIAGCGGTDLGPGPAGARSRPGLEPVLAAASVAPRAYDVGAGPAWETATAYSCLEACALLFGGVPADWACSTSAAAPDHFAWYSRYGSAESCGPTGTPLAEDFNPGGTYVAAGASAYVDDWCFAGEGSINYCFPSAPPPPAPRPGHRGGRAGHGDPGCGDHDADADGCSGGDRPHGRDRGGDGSRR